MQLGRRRYNKVRKKNLDLLSISIGNRSIKINNLNTHIQAKAPFSLLLKHYGHKLLRVQWFWAKLSTMFLLKMC